MKLCNLVKKIKNLYGNTFIEDNNLTDCACELFIFIDENIKLLNRYNKVDYNNIYKSYYDEKNKYNNQIESKSLFEFVFNNNSICKLFCQNIFNSNELFNLILHNSNESNNIIYLNNLYIIVFFTNSYDKATILIDKITNIIVLTTNEFHKISYYKILNDVLTKFNIPLNVEFIDIIKNIEYFIEPINDLFFPKLKNILSLHKVK